MTKTFILAGLSALLLAAASCDGTGSDKRDDDPQQPGPDDGDPQNWKPGDGTGECNVDALLGPHAYGTKIKTLLTGLPLTDEELVSLREDESSLPDMIDGWLAQPEADGVLQRFFMTAFQQDSGNNESLFNLLGVNARQVGRFTNPNSARADDLLNRNFSNSFALSVLDMVKNGEPFTKVLDTDTYYMTTAMMMFLAFTDDRVVNDEGNISTRTTAGHFPTIRILRDGPQPPLAQVLNPSSPNYMTFYHSGMATLPTACNVAASQTIDTTQNVNGEWRISGNVNYFVFSALLLGRLEGVRRHNQTNCNAPARNMVPVIDRNDFADWRPVQLVKPADGQDADYFYDVVNLRGQSDLALHTDRLGFFTHPGFFSTWPNNEDNSARVTINQTLIVALGASFDGEAVTDFTSDAINAEHADPTTECYGCHQTLDPMRDYFRASYTNFYGQQLDEERMGLEADFVFKGVEASGNGVRDLALALESHPLFPYAWAHKLCYYANAAPCAEGEELDRVVAAFVESNHDFRVLIRELFSSPLVTGSACVSGVDAGTEAIIARQSTFCNQLSVRLGTPDICALQTTPEDASNLQDDMNEAVASIPDDTYSRSVIEPVIIGQTGMFTRANREAACNIYAQDGFDDVFTGMGRDEVLAMLVESIMALPPSDERHAEALAILNEHVDEVIAGGDSETLALQSAFALACMSPGSAGIGF